MTPTRMPVLQRPSRDDLMSLGAEWDDLLAASGTVRPFLTWAWVRAWLATVGSAVDLEIVTARDPDDGTLLGVAPFFVETNRKLGVAIRRLRLVGNGPAAPDHLDLLVRTDAPHAAEALWNAVIEDRRWDLLDFDGVASGGNLARLVLRRRGDSTEPIDCPYLPLEGGWEAVRGRFGRNHRQNLGRYTRKLDAESALPVSEWMVATPADLEATFDRLVTMHQAVRSTKGQPGVFADPSVVEFLRMAAHGFLETGRLRMWRLDVGDDPIAVVWCIRAGDSVVFYTTGFDRRWARFGPGRRIMARAIRGAIDEGATEFDFLRGDEPYKRSWGTQIRRDVRIRRPSGPKGRLLSAARSIRRTLTGPRRVASSSRI
ncbi:MAG: GNAT family N-acetyltransferase [Acidimicrobiia bacterium]